MTRGLGGVATPQTFGQERILTICCNLTCETKPHSSHKHNSRQNVGLLRITLRKKKKKKPLLVIEEQLCILFCSLKEVMSVFSALGHTERSEVSLPNQPYMRWLQSSGLPNKGWYP